MKLEVVTLNPSLGPGAAVIPSSASFTVVYLIQPVTMNRYSDGSCWNNSARFCGCQFFWLVNNDPAYLFGTPTM